MTIPDPAALEAEAGVESEMSPRANPESSASPPAPAHPHAVMFRESFKRGKTFLDRLTFVQKTLGPRLGPAANPTSLGPDYGGQLHVSDVGGGWWFARHRAEDQPSYARDHEEYPGEPRYRWEDQPDGTRNGYLIEADGGTSAL
jgi:hypothetical protein